MAEDLVEHWIWLQQVFGAGSPKPDKLVKEFGSVGAVYEAGQADYLKTGFLTEKEIRRLNNKSLERSKKIVSDCMKNGYKILTAPDMPQRLQDIYAPPCVLYLWGDLPQPYDSLYIAMVGTRNVTPYGVEVATKLSVGLARCGVTVVSGLAVGVDAAAHKGALKGGGKTVAVVGGGIDIDYPSGHRELKRLISQNGAVVSEYPPGTSPARANFPIRNRIIAGLSLGCVVVEAGSRSGALITASLAAEMGRDVFAVPGSIFSSESKGTNRLLRDGVKPVCGVMDILEEYIGLFPQNIISKITSRELEIEEQQLNFDSVKNSSQSTASNAERPPLAKGTKENADELPFITLDNNNGLQSSAGTESTAKAKYVENNSVKSYPRAVSSHNEGGKTKQLPTSAGNREVNSANHLASCHHAASSHDEEEKINQLPTSAGNRDVNSANYLASCPRAAGLSEKQLLVYNVLSEVPQHVDDIALKANMELRTVLAVLTTLEIEGYVQSFPGRRYKLAR